VREEPDAIYQRLVTLYIVLWRHQEREKLAGKSGGKERAGKKESEK
jgi:hypothetical protein